jgi:hypothetical protein
MRRLVFLAVAIMLMAPAITLAQAATAQPPRPGPEHQALAALIGNWTSEGECSATPMTPAEKWSAKLKSEWFPGKFAVVRHLESKGTVTGESVGLEILTYDSQAKAYTWYGVDSFGWNGTAKGSIAKDVLTVTWPATVKGKAYKVRGILKGLGSDKLLWTMEYSGDGKTWKAACTATDIRVKAN